MEQKYQIVDVEVILIDANPSTEQFMQDKISNDFKDLNHKVEVLSSDVIVSTSYTVEDIDDLAEIKKIVEGYAYRDFHRLNYFVKEVKVRTRI